MAVRALVDGISDLQVVIVSQLFAYVVCPITPLAISNEFENTMIFLARVVIDAGEVFPVVPEVRVL